VTRYLLDTNVISELRKPRPHGAVVAWVGGLQESEIYLSAVSVGELQTRIERARRQDQQKAAEIEKWLEEVSASCQVLPMDGGCFREWARLMERQPECLLEDVMIAATARVHQLTVATRNERDFAKLGVQILNPFHIVRQA